MQTGQKGKCKGKRECKRKDRKFLRPIALLLVIALPLFTCSPVLALPLHEETRKKNANTSQKDESISCPLG